jgi:protease-4
MQKRNWLLIFLVVAVFVISAGLFLSGIVMILVGTEMAPKQGDIAVVKLEGEIVDSAKFIEEIEDIAEREDIQAVVIRIDSPGGLVSPSQEMYRAIVRLRKDKKVVASMGTLAASGAYYVAVGAEKIVANEGTITGSIGVKINHINIEDLVTLARLKPRVLTTGPYKDMGSPLRPLKPEEERLFKKIIFQMHDQFKKVVAQERGLEKEKVDEIADGRVYTGQEALKLGLVDVLGSLQDAIDVAADLAKIEGKPEVVYPKKKGEHWIRYFVQESLSAVRVLMEESRREPMFLWRM